MYIAIIGDLIDSRNLNNRYEVQQRLNKVLADINSNYKLHIESNFIITLGDEFQGLLSCETEVFNIVEDIQREMFPSRIRFGIGIGDITTEINRAAAIGADGPAYYKAREMVNLLKSKEKEDGLYQSLMIGIDKVETSPHQMKIAFYEKMANTIIELMATIETRWTDEQRKTIWDLQKNGGTQSECAVRMSVKQSTVSKRLTSGNYLTYVNAKDALQSLMSIMMEETKC